MSSLINLSRVSKTYSLGNTNFQALKDVNLEITRGEMVAIVGTSGSGKSTLMNIIGLLDKPTTGQYQLANRDVAGLSDDELATIRNAKIGFVFQSFYLLPRSTALQNVVLPLFYRGTQRDEANQRAMALLEKVGVAQFAHHRPNQLSGGQQQRVAIARALVGDPDIILADEPTGALDSQTGQEVMQLLQSLHDREGRTIVIITHDQTISQRCQRTVLIQDGRII